MSRPDAIEPRPLAAIFSRGRKAFIPFVMAGDPDLETTGRVVRTLVEAGADAVELGVPFTDPVADGPTNQRAAERALRSGTTLAKVLELARDLRASAPSAPIILFTYLNPLLAYGRPLDAVDAALVVDPDPEPLDDEERLLAGVDRIHLASPSTSEPRLRALAGRAGSFVYYVSRYGVTGARAELPPSLGCEVARVRSLSSRPVAVGFGISTPAQAAAVARVADGVVVGSALVERIERSGREAPADLKPFAEEVARAVHSV